MKRNFARMLAIVLAMLVGELPQLAKAGQPDQAALEKLSKKSGNFKVADGLHKPILLDAAGKNKNQTGRGISDAGLAGGLQNIKLQNGGTNHPPLVPKTPADKLDKKPLPIDFGKVSGLDPKLQVLGKGGKLDLNPGKLDLNKGKLDLNKGIINKLPLDPQFGKGPNLKPLKPSTPTIQCGNGNVKCLPWKPWNPWCNPLHHWYPCYPIFDPCDPCCHWHPTITILYIDCPSVYICDPLYVYRPVVIEEGVALADLKLEDIRLVDNGDAAQGLGPAYRMLVSNRSNVDVAGRFQVTLLATLGDAPSDKSPRAHGAIEGLAAGKSTIVDVRLPVESLAMGEMADGTKLAFSKLVAIVDSRREVPEMSESNNATAYARDSIALVRPTVFGFDKAVTAQGGELIVMGEGFGDSAGQAYLIAGGLKLKASVSGWMSNGLRLTLPEFDGAADLKVVVVRADGEVSEAASLPIQVAQQ